MDKRRKKEPLSIQFCLRINERQHRLLKDYIEVRDLKNEVDALRHIIDGLAPWLNRQRRASAKAETDADTEEHQSASSIKEESDADNTSVGDFGGRPCVGLPRTAGNRTSGIFFSA